MIRRMIPYLSALALGLVLLAGTRSVAGTLEITGPAGAEVYVNDQLVGLLPLDGPFEATPGEYEVRSEWPGYMSFRKTVTIFYENENLRVNVRLLPLKKGTAWRSSILYAGLGQFYLGHKTRGWIYVAAESAGLITALMGELDRSNLSDDYSVIMDNYNNAINAGEIEGYKSQASQTYDDLVAAEDMRNTGLIIAGSAIVISVIDALISFPDLEAGPGTIPLQTGWLNDSGSEDVFSAAHVGVRMGF
jgi:hypothetical protein